MCCCIIQDARAILCSLTQHQSVPGSSTASSRSTDLPRGAACSHERSGVARKATGRNASMNSPLPPRARRSDRALASPSPGPSRRAPDAVSAAAHCARTTAIRLRGVRRRLWTPAPRTMPAGAGQHPVLSAPSFRTDTVVSHGPSPLRDPAGTRCSPIPEEVPARASSPPCGLDRPD